jgi:hypothetical protein
MKTSRHIGFRLLAAMSGIATAIVHFHHAHRWAHIEATGEPKLEMPTWWMAGESMLSGMVATLLILAIASAINRIRRGRAG